MLIHLYWLRKQRECRGSMKRTYKIHIVVTALYIILTSTACSYSALQGKANRPMPAATPSPTPVVYFMSPVPGAPPTSPKLLTTYHSKGPQAIGVKQSVWWAYEIICDTPASPTDSVQVTVYNRHGQKLKAWDDFGAGCNGTMGIGIPYMAICQGTYQVQVNEVESTTVDNWTLNLYTAPDDTACDS